MCYGFSIVTSFPYQPSMLSGIGVRSILALIASQNWNVNSTDVKTAFLQGRKVERTVYLHPVNNIFVIWKLQKWVYGLADVKTESKDKQHRSRTLLLEREQHTYQYFSKLH